MSKPAAKSTIGDMPDLDAFVNQGRSPVATVLTTPPVITQSTAAAQPAQPTVVLTTRIPPDFHRRMKVHVARTGRTLQDFALQAFENQLVAEQENG